MLKTVQIQYFAILREQRGESAETMETAAPTAQDLYHELQKKYNFTLTSQLIRVAINNEFKSWDTILNPGDHIVFIPPVAGG